MPNARVASMAMVVFFVFMFLLLFVNLWGVGFSLYLRGGQEIRGKGL